MASQATARRAPRSDGYGRYTRFYEVPDGGRYPSVTAILGAINKPALVNWAAKTEREMVIRAAADLWDDASVSPKMSRLAFVSALDKRIGSEKAHSKALAAAADIGTQAHGMVEWTLRKELGQLVGPVPRLSDKALWAFMVWEDWRKQANLVPLLIEQVVWSGKNGYAGTLDLYAELDLPTGGRGRVVLDWKTAKALYPESSLQNAAYVEALMEMGHAHRPTHGMVVRMPKVETDPEFETRFIPYEMQAQLLKTFLHVLELWKWMDSSNG